MEYFHIILEFEKEGKIYVCTRFDIQDEDLVEDFAHQFETNDLIIVNGYKVNSNCKPCLRIFKSFESFANYKKNCDGYTLSDEGLVRSKEFSEEVTNEFLKTSFWNFKIKIK